MASLSRVISQEESYKEVEIKARTMLSHEACHLPLRQKKHSRSICMSLCLCQEFDFSRYFRVDTDPRKQIIIVIIVKLILLSF